jgi:multiple sugar transport system substrate-binding protein
VIKLLFMRTGIVPSRFSVAADPGVRRGSRVIAAVDEMARLGQLRLWPRPPVKEYSKIVEILGEDIHAMLRKDQSVKAALSNAQARIDALMRANGRY